MLARSALSVARVVRGAPLRLTAAAAPQLAVHARAMATVGQALDAAVEARPMKEVFTAVGQKISWDSKELSVRGRRVRCSCCCRRCCRCNCRKSACRVHCARAGVVSAIAGVVTRGRARGSCRRVAHRCACRTRRPVLRSRCRRCAYGGVSACWRSLHSHVLLRYGPLSSSRMWTRCYARTALNGARPCLCAYIERCVVLSCGVLCWSGRRTSRASLVACWRWATPRAPPSRCGPTTTWSTYVVQQRLLLSLFGDHRRLARRERQ